MARGKARPWQQSLSAGCAGYGHSANLADAAHVQGRQVQQLKQPLASAVGLANPEFLLECVATSPVRLIACLENGRGAVFMTWGRLASMASLPGLMAWVARF